MRFSIIVPVYNVEKYLSTCIDSILDQSLQDFQIILIDDGSPDKCGEICDNYQKLFPDKIMVHHQKNSGLSAARNKGVKLAQGEYVIFVDSDDFILPDSLSGINQVCNNLPDCIITEMYNTEYIYQNFESAELFELPLEVDRSSVFNYVFHKKKHIQGAVQYIVKRSFLLENNLFFEVGFYHEDNVYTPLMLSHGLVLSMWI